MSSRLLCAVSLLAACASGTARTTTAAVPRCDNQWVAVVANGSRVTIDVFDPRAETQTVLGTVDAGREREIFLNPPTTWVQFRPTSSTDKNFRSDLIRVRYVCR